MDISKLMIGDWVYYKPKTKDECIVGKVNLIRDDGVIQVDYSDVLIGDVRPIPLKTEILELNDFVEVYHYYPYPTYEFRGIENCVVRVAFPKNSDKTKYTKPFIEIDSESVLIEHVNVEYVHELQCALKVGEIGKEIEL